MRKPLDTDPLSMLAFKIMDDPHVGSITFCRVYSGKVESGMALANTTRDKKERVGRMYLMHADDREQISEAFAGDIIALAGLKDTRTGETLSDPNKPVLLEKMDFPNPVIEMKIEPKTKADVEKMGAGAGQAGRRGPLVPRHLRSGERRDHHQGHGRAASGDQGRHPEAHPQGRSERRRAAGGLSRDFGARHRGRLHAQEADRRHRPVCAREAAAGAERARQGNEFESEIIGGVVPKEYIPGVEKGVQSVWDSGVLIGFPMVDMKVTLYDGNYHEVDSSAIAFEIASRQAMREGCNKAGVKLLEPIMDVEVVTPGDFVGSVIGDINSRRGQIRSQEMRGNATVVRANVPLANMFGYVSQLRSMSQGRAMYTMQFAHYAEVPRNVADEVKAKYA